MFPFRLAAVDLDDTLLGPDKRISGPNAAAIARLLDQGVIVTLASGRIVPNMLPTYRELGLRGPLVACNGAWVGEPTTGELVRERTVAESIAADLLRLGDAAGVTPMFHDSTGLFIRQSDEWSALYEKRSSEAATVVGDYARLAGRRPHKITWYGSPQRIASLKDQLIHQYRGVLTIFSTEKENIEFVPHGVDKSTGVAAVAAAFGIVASEIVAFGDGLNDVGLLTWAGLGVAMDHGHPEALASAKVVPQRGNRDTALARAIEAVLSRFQ